MRTFTSFCLLGAGVAVFAVDTAAGQSYFQRDRYESVDERTQPEFDPVPVRVGTFLVRPALDAELIFDDNVLAAPDGVPGPDSDTIVRIVPRVNARSNWANHEIAGDLNVEHLEYQDLSDESRTNVRGALRGRLDVNRELSLRAGVFGQDLTQDRRDIAAAQLFENVEYTNVGGSAGADYEQGRIRLSGTVRTAELDYDDNRTRSDRLDVVAVIINDQDFRDRRETSIEGRVSYAVSPDVAIFTQAAINERDYNADAQDLANGTQSVAEVNGRDSQGYALTVGSNFELTTLIRGEVAVGYFEDEPDGTPSIPGSDEPISGLALDSRIQWFPTRLTTVTAQASRQANDPGIVNAANAILTTGTLRVDHELRRNIVIFGETGLSQQEFDSQTQFDDEVFNIGAGGTYKLNRNVHLNGYVRHYNRSSDSVVRDFDQNVIGIGLTLYP